MYVSRIFVASVLALAANGLHAQIALTGAPVQQNFDSLVNSGTGTQAQVPTGWTFLETTGNTSYTAADGAATSGDTYSAGSTGSTDRAFATIASNSNQPTIGAQLVNQTGSNIAELTIAFTGEQWRAGGSNLVDRLTFSISTDATGLSGGTWTPVPALDVVAPIQGATVQSLNGNLPANQTSVSQTITGLAIGTNQTFWIRWVDPNIAGADDMLGIDNVIISTTGGVDVPPTVNSTTPANNATNVAPNANIAVQFSEAVTTNAGWFALNCATSGAVALTESGSGATRTLDPTPLLASGEQCTATITAANVIDQDGTPDPMAANYQFAFTVAVDNPPTVTSTTPANGVSEVPVGANLVVNFSEPVTVGGSWYSISCANSGVHAAVVSGGPQSYILNPNVNFDLAELCTVTLTASLIQDIDGTPDPLAANYVWSFTSATTNLDYYASVNASNATVLRTTLHALIKDHVAYPYTGAGPCNPSAPTPTTCDTWDILDLADQNPANPAEIIDLYQNDKHPKAGGGNANYNREHTWPNSHGFNDLSGNDSNGNPWSTYTDTHMLYLADITYNANRGNSPYDDCIPADGCTEDATVANNGFGGQGGAPFPGDSNWKNASKYMTWNHRKGDVARAILYMDVRYEGGTHANGQPEPDLIATDNDSQIAIVTPSGQFAPLGYMGKLTTLLAWHAADPPDAQEILRNGVVYGFQGNRNPFIDHPEWVACLWQNQCGAGNNVFANGFE